MTGLIFRNLNCSAFVTIEIALDKVSSTEGSVYLLFTDLVDDPLSL